MKTKLVKESLLESNTVYKAYFFITDKDGNDLYRINIQPILKASGNRDMWNELVSTFNLKPDKYMGVVWSNHPNSTVSLDTEESHINVPLTFALKDLDKINKILKTNILI